MKKVPSLGLQRVREGTHVFALHIDESVFPHRGLQHDLRMLQNLWVSVEGEERQGRSKI